MHEHISPSRLRRLLLVLALTASALVGVVAWAASRPAATETSERAVAAMPAAPGPTIVPPTRAAEHHSEQVAPPTIPGLLTRVTPLTLVVETLETQHGKTRTQRKTVTRGTQRIHVAIDNGAEWLFVQNAVDKRRVSATLVDHHRRTLVEYSESELRASGLARGWSDVVGLGVRPEVLANAKWTTRKKEAFGFEFVEAERADGAIRSLWWSRDAAIPLGTLTTSESGSTEMVVRSVSERVDPSPLGDIRERYPTYATMDVADFREAHREHADHDAAHH